MKTDTERADEFWCPPDDLPVTGIEFWLDYEFQAEPFGSFPKHSGSPVRIGDSEVEPDGKEAQQGD